MSPFDKWFREERSRIESNPRGDLQELDLSRVVAELEPEIRTLMSPSIVLETDLPPGLPRIRGAGGAVRLAIMRLVENACEAMSFGGRLRVSTCVRESAAGATFVAVVVQDTGGGVPAAVRGRLFEPFVTTKGRDRRGLGLATVYGTALAHGGTLELETTGETGSTFVLTFPRVADVCPYPIGRLISATGGSLSGS